MFDEPESPRAPVVRDARDPAHGSAELPFDFGTMLLEALDKAPDRCAFRFQGQALTRAQLREETLKLAARLREADLPTSAPVVLDIAHSLELVVAMCAIQVAGACAVPIDPDVSAERRAAILADIRPAFVLTRGAAGKGRVAVEITRGADREPDQTEAGLAFIVYTSGTSGGPKGVMITEESYVRRMRHIVPTISIRDSDTDLAWTPSSFITMVDEIFLPLLIGLPTVIAEPSIRTDPRAFLALVERERVTTFRITPSLLNMVLRTPGAAKALARVRTLICSGEAMPAALQTMVHKELSADLLGFYGATEAPAVAFRAFDSDLPPVETTICTPQPFVDLRVAREDGSEAAVGETGELWVGGCALARGYYRRPELTAEKFIERDGARWYRTGDLTRRLAGGDVEILGRSDMSEVNIHGVRISLPEICEALRDLDGIDDAWVSLVNPEAGRDPVLVGQCLIAEGTAFDPEALRAALTRKLPTLAVPRYLLSHDSFPLAANGKLDVQVLAREATGVVVAAEARGRQGAGRPPASPTERVVLDQVRQALDKADIQVEDNFFDAGGTSLEAVTLACLVSDHFGTEIGFEEIWLHPSAQALAEFVDRHGGARSARSFFHVDGVAGQNLFVIGFGVSHLAGLWPDRRLMVNPGISGDPRVSLRKRLGDYVAEYVEGIRRVQPNGPYQLIGFSFSGLLAYEVARALRAEGEEIAGLALIEPVTPVAQHAGRSYARAALGRVLRALAARRRAELRHMMRLVRNSLTGAQIRPTWRQLRAYGHVVAAAEPLEPYPGPVDLIYCDDFPAELVAKWQSVAGDRLRLSKVRAEDHQTLIRPESIQQWKAVVDRWSTQD